MLKSMTDRIARTVEAMLPTTTADAGCPPDTYTEYKIVGGDCCARTCSFTAKCALVCGPWDYTANWHC
ncbi:hypothetical protein AB0L06_17600 [Spirillospora sp. NPDC052269]